MRGARRQSQRHGMAWRVSQWKRLNRRQIKIVWYATHERSKDKKTYSAPMRLILAKALTTQAILIERYDLYIFMFIHRMHATYFSILLPFHSRRCVAIEAGRRMLRRIGKENHTYKFWSWNRWNHWNPLEIRPHVTGHDIYMLSDSGWALTCTFRFGTSSECDCISLRRVQQTKGERVHRQRTVRDSVFLRAHPLKFVCLFTRAFIHSRVRIEIYMEIKIMVQF